MVRNVNKVIVVGSALTLLISFWNRNDLPGNIQFTPGLESEPKQSLSLKRPFSIEHKGVTYLVEPEYDYELYGMIVSYRHHNGNSRMHRLSNDHLNIADLCVVWGDTASSPYLNELKFWNGIFTCNVSTSDPDAWNAFRMEQLSNNHLLSDDEVIRDRVEDIKIGDQVRLHGWLSSYSSAGGSKRGTSITRTDSGDGACETIFLNEFEIVETTIGPWRLTMYASLIVLFLSLIIHFRLPYRPYG